MPKRILVLDGGGVKGVITLKFLSLLEQSRGINIAEFFDYFAGTSTGGLIATLFAYKRLSATEILEKVYTLENVAKIMSQGYYEWALSQIQIRSKYSDREKLNFINQMICGNVCLSDVKTPLLLVAFNPVKKVPILFRNYFHSPDYLLSEACNATSAAPTYFPVAKVTIPKTTVHKEETTCGSEGGVTINVNNRDPSFVTNISSEKPETDCISTFQQNDSEPRDTACSSRPDNLKQEETCVELTKDVIGKTAIKTEEDAMIIAQSSDKKVIVSTQEKAVDEVKENVVAPPILAQVKLADVCPSDFMWAIDGGIFANNPCDLAYLDAKTFFGNDKLHVLSVGTGISRSKFQKITNPSLGGWDWMIDDHIIDLLLDSNQVSSHIRTKQLCRNAGDNYLRVNEYLKVGSSDLDNVTKFNYDKLIEEGESWWKLYSDHDFFKSQLFPQQSLSQ